MTEKCLKCGSEVHINNLRKHVERCSRSLELNENRDSDDEDDDGVGNQSAPTTVYFESSDEERGDNEDGEYLDTTLKLAVQQSHSSVPGSVSLQSVLMSLKSGVKDKTMTLSVRRGHVLEDAIRAARRPCFDVSHSLKIKFFGEPGDDVGGLKREYFTLLAREISASLCEGMAYNHVIRHDSIGLQENKFLLIGQLMAQSIIHGGSGFPFFAQSVYSYLCGISISSIGVQTIEVPAELDSIHQLIKKIELVETDSELQDICSTNGDLMAEIGFLKPCRNIQVGDKEQLLKTVKLHFTIMKSLPEMEQLKEGLCSLGLMDAMKKNKEIFTTMFTATNTVLTADQIESLFSEIAFSHPGSVNREREEDAYMMFLDLLYDIQVGIEKELTLSDVLMFFSGSDIIPPLGYDEKPTLRFDPDNPFPMAQTCSLQLTLPTTYFKMPHMFRQKLLYGIKNNGGFGVV